jgi:hypothetical protein
MSGIDERIAESGRRPRRRGAGIGVVLLAGAALLQSAWRPAHSAPPPPVASYDRDYPALVYSGDAVSNAIAALQSRIASGDIVLDERAGRGFLDALLAALDIEPASQVLVFSKTSLQASYIDSEHPRAIYFNDSTYVAWVQGSDHLEIVAIDDDRGPVFFSVDNVAPQPRFERQTTLCLACHDSAALSGGGVPLVLVRSSSVVGEMNPAGRLLPATVTHATAVEDRWGGWYVTGRLGVQQHLGNLPLATSRDSAVSEISNRSNLPGLSGYFDTAPYMSDKSDIVALLVLEHQSYVHNLLTRAKYVLAGRSGVTLDEASSPEDVSSADRAVFEAVLDPLAAAMTFADERRLLGRIRGTAGFEAAFTAAGPMDGCGRSLRTFDLVSRTFRYPVSYLVYASAFQSLPSVAKRYLYERFVALLSTPTGSAAFDRDRAAALEILAETLPEFAGIARPAPTPAACG